MPGPIGGECSLVEGGASEVGGNATSSLFAGAYPVWTDIVAVSIASSGVALAALIVALLVYWFQWVVGKCGDTSVKNCGANESDSGIIGAAPLLSTSLRSRSGCHITSLASSSVTSAIMSDSNAGESSSVPPSTQEDMFFTWDSGGNSGDFLSDSFVHTAVELPKYSDSPITEDERQMLLMYVQNNRPELLAAHVDNANGIHRSREVSVDKVDPSLIDPSGTSGRGYLETIVEENSDDLRSPSECDENSLEWGSWDESDDDRVTVVEVKTTTPQSHYSSTNATFGVCSTSDEIGCNTQNVCIRPSNITNVEDYNLSSLSSFNDYDGVHCQNGTDSKSEALVLNSTSFDVDDINQSGDPSFTEFNYFTTGYFNKVSRDFPSLRSLSELDGQTVDSYSSLDYFSIQEQNNENLGLKNNSLNQNFNPFDTETHNTKLDHSSPESCDFEVHYNLDPRWSTSGILSQHEDDTKIPTSSEDKESFGLRSDESDLITSTDVSHKTIKNLPIHTSGDCEDDNSLISMVPLSIIDDNLPSFPNSGDVSTFKRCSGDSTINAHNQPEIISTENSVQLIPSAVNINDNCDCVTTDDIATDNFKDYFLPAERYIPLRLKQEKMNFPDINESTDGFLSIESIPACLPDIIAKKRDKIRCFRIGFNDEDVPESPEEQFIHNYNNNKTYSDGSTEDVVFSAREGDIAFGNSWFDARSLKEPEMMVDVSGPEVSHPIMTADGRRATMPSLEPSPDYSERRKKLPLDQPASDDEADVSFSLSRWQHHTDLQKLEEVTSPITRWQHQTDLHKTCTEKPVNDDSDQEVFLPAQLKTIYSSFKMRDRRMSRIKIKDDKNQFLTLGLWENETKVTLPPFGSTKGSDDESKIDSDEFVKEELDDLELDMFAVDQMQANGSKEEPDQPTDESSGSLSPTEDFSTVNRDSCQKIESSHENDSYPCSTSTLDAEDNELYTLKHSKSSTDLLGDELYNEFMEIIKTEKLKSKSDNNLSFFHESIKAGVTKDHEIPCLKSTHDDEDFDVTQVCPLCTKSNFTEADLDHLIFPTALTEAYGNSELQVLLNKTYPQLGTFQGINQSGSAIREITTKKDSMSPVTSSDSDEGIASVSSKDVKKRTKKRIYSKDEIHEQKHDDSGYVEDDEDDEEDDILGEEESAKENTKSYWKIPENSCKNPVLQNGSLTNISTSISQQHDESSNYPPQLLENASPKECELETATSFCNKPQELALNLSDIQQQSNEVTSFTTQEEVVAALSIEHEDLSSHTAFEQPDKTTKLAFNKFDAPLSVSQLSDSSNVSNTSQPDEKLCTSVSTKSEIDDDYPTSEKWAIPESLSEFSAWLLDKELEKISSRDLVEKLIVSDIVSLREQTIRQFLEDNSSYNNDLYELPVKNDHFNELPRKLENSQSSSKSGLDLTNMPDILNLRNKNLELLSEIPELDEGSLDKTCSTENPILPTSNNTKPIEKYILAKGLEEVFDDSVNYPEYKTENLIQKGEYLISNSINSDDQFEANQDVIKNSLTHVENEVLKLNFDHSEEQTGISRHSENTLEVEISSEFYERPLLILVADDNRSLVPDEPNSERPQKVDPEIVQEITHSSDTRCDSVEAGALTATELNNNGQKAAGEILSLTTRDASLLQFPLETYSDPIENNPRAVTPTPEETVLRKTPEYQANPMNAFPTSVNAEFNNYEVRNTITPYGELKSGFSCNMVSSIDEGSEVRNSTVVHTLEAATFKTITKETTLRITPKETTLRTTPEVLTELTIPEVLTLLSTPEELIVQITPEKTIAQTRTEEIIVQTTPEEAILQTTPKETSVQTTPAETIVQTTPEEAILQTTPEETSVQTTPTETIVQTGPEETIVQTTPEEAIVQTIPEEAIVQTYPEETIVQITQEKKIAQTTPEKTIIKTIPEKIIFQTTQEKTIVRSTAEERTLQTALGEPTLRTVPKETALRTNPGFRIIAASSSVNKKACGINSKDSVCSDSDTASDVLPSIVQKNDYSNPGSGVLIDNPERTPPLGPDPVTRGMYIEGESHTAAESAPLVNGSLGRDEADVVVCFRDTGVEKNPLSGCVTDSGLEHVLSVSVYDCDALFTPLLPNSLPIACNDDCTVDVATPATLSKDDSTVTSKSNFLDDVTEPSVNSTLDLNAILSCSTSNEAGDFFVIADKIPTGYATAVLPDVTGSRLKGNVIFNTLNKNLCNQQTLSSCFSAPKNDNKEFDRSGSNIGECIISSPDLSAPDIYSGQVIQSLSDRVSENIHNRSAAENKCTSGKKEESFVDVETESVFNTSSTNCLENQTVNATFKSSSLRIVPPKQVGSEILTKPCATISQRDLNGHKPYQSFQTSLTPLERNSFLAEKKIEANNNYVTTHPTNPDIVSSCGLNLVEYRRSKSLVRNDSEGEGSDLGLLSQSEQSKSTPDLRRCEDTFLSTSSAPLSALLSKSVSQRIQDYLGQSNRGSVLHRSLPPTERSRHYRRICVSSETVVEKAARFESQHRSHSSGGSRRPLTLTRLSGEPRSGSCPPLGSQWSGRGQTGNMWGGNSYISGSTWHDENNTKLQQRNYRAFSNGSTLYNKPTATVKPSREYFMTSPISRDGQWTCQDTSKDEYNQSGNKRNLMERITGYGGAASPASRLTHKPPLPPTYGLKTHHLDHTSGIKGRIATARKDFFERLSGKQELIRNQPEVNPEPGLNRLDVFRRSAREGRDRLAASHPDLGALEAEVRRSRRKIDLEEREKYGVYETAPTDDKRPGSWFEADRERAGRTVSTASARSHTPACTPYRRCTGEIAWASCAKRVREAKEREAKSHSQGLLETDVDDLPPSENEPLHMRARSLLALGESSGEQEPFPGEEIPSPVAISPGEEPLTSRARSMDFLLDADNRDRVLPPENQLGTSKGRVKSEHELRIERSLQNLTIPDWYKQSAWSKKPSEGFILRRGSEGAATDNSSNRRRWRGFSTSRTPSASSLTTNSYSQRNVVIPKRITPGTSTDWRYVSSLMSSRESLPPVSPASLSPRDCATFQYGLQSQSSLSRWSSTRLSTSSAPLSAWTVHRSFRQPYLGWRAAAASSIQTPTSGGSRSSPGLSPAGSTPVYGSRPASPRRTSQEHPHHQVTSSATLRPDSGDAVDTSRISPLALYDNANGVFFNTSAEIIVPQIEETEYTASKINRAYEEKHRSSNVWPGLRRDRYSYTQSLYNSAVIVSPGLEDDGPNSIFHHIPQEDVIFHQHLVVGVEDRSTLVTSPQPPPRVWMESSFVGTKKKPVDQFIPMSGRPTDVPVGDTNLPCDQSSSSSLARTTAASVRNTCAPPRPMGEYALRDFRRFGITL